jgi:sterol desaturase/sphingolipid hydroxylase (fatty acid hydroxylase superfamily)
VGPTICRDNFLILQTLIGATVVNSPLLPGLRQLCLWDPRGWAVALLLHVGFSEPVFYLAHRALHRAPLFARYHAAHHSSGVTQPLTGSPLRRLQLHALLLLLLLLYYTMYYFQDQSCIIDAATISA